VKLIRVSGIHSVFEISKWERRMLSGVLRLYPLMPATHHRLSKKSSTVKENENQGLLEESLAAHRKENQKRVLAMLSEPERFQTKASGYHLTLSRSEIEWLLQVLNDVRVGSWIALGSPETLYGKRISLDEKTVSHIRSMEVAGAFEMVLLSAQSGRMSSG
jgi:hypothetical protein